MRERLVKGTNLIGIVRLLRSHKRSGVQLPEMGAWEQDLLRMRLSPSSWYALSVFDSLLQHLHRYVFDGSEAAAHHMGREFASSARDARADSKRGKTALEALASHSGTWRNHFNFGELSVSPFPLPSSEDGARVQVHGYPEMSACHGLSIVGWSTQVLEDAGARDVQMRIEERPWMHASTLTYILTWG